MARLARHFALIALFLVSLLPGRAHADQPVVLLVKPATSGAVTRHQIGAVHLAVREAIGKAGAGIAVLGDVKVQAQLKRLGASDLSSRPKSLEVAKGIGAHAVLRYQIIKTKVGTKLRMAVYTVAGKASLLEREQPDDMTNAAAGSMVKELLKGALPAAGAAVVPKAKQGKGTPTDPKANRGTGTGTGTGTGSPGAAVGASVWSSSGLTLQIHLGGAIPLGSGATEFLSAGFRFAAIAGFEIKLGAHASLAPEVALRLTTGSWKDGSSIAGIPIAKGGATMTTFGGGLRLSIYAWRLGFVVAAHAGFGNITVTFEDSSGASADDSNLGFAFGTDFGVQFQVLRYLAAGLFFDITKTFTDGFQIDVGTSTAGDDISGLALSIGLAIKGKLPL